MRFLSALLSGAWIFSRVDTSDMVKPFFTDIEGY